MKIRILLLCVSLFSTALMMAPPAFGYVPEPMFGVSWRPDLCVDGSPGVQMCLGTFLHVQDVNNQAIDASQIDIFGLFGCLDWPCRIESYENYMNAAIPQTCYYTFIGTNDDELASWCVELFNITIQQTLNDWNQNSCTGLCLKAKPPIGKKIIPTIGEPIERRLAKPF